MSMVPGVQSLAFAARWFDPATVARVFEPLIADWQREWQTARPAQRPWVRVRGLAAFAIATLVSSPAIVTTPPPPALMRRLIARIALFVAIVSTLLVIPILTDMPSLSRAVLLSLLLSLIPSGAVLALPFSMMLAVDVIRRQPDLAPHVARATALRLAISAVIFMAIGHGFVVPAANQQFRLISSRELIAAQGAVSPRGYAGPMPGLRERSTIELLTDADRQEPARRGSRAGAIRSELTNRAVLALMPAIFIWLRWIAHDVRRPRRFWPLPIAAMVIVSFIGFFASYWSGAFSERALNLRPGDGLWLPIVIATLIGVTQQWITSRRNTPPETA
jgi:hypothetical protein